MFKVNNKDTRKMPMALQKCLYCQLWTYFIPFLSVSIINFEQVNAGWGCSALNPCGICIYSLKLHS